MYSEVREGAAKAEEKGAKGFFVVGNNASGRVCSSEITTRVVNKTFVAGDRNKTIVPLC